MYDQLTELLTNYGKIDILWTDFSYPGKDRDPRYAHAADLPGKARRCCFGF